MANEPQLYEETMLDIAPMLDEFPMDEFDEDLLSPMLQEAGSPAGQLVIPSYGEFIDPDMFLNGVVKRESESDCSSGSRRNTPSPSDSQRSYESYPSSGYGSCQSNNPMNNILLDSPPVSPENPLHVPPSIVTLPATNVVRVGTAQLPTVQKPSCVTNLADLKKIKLPPKAQITKKTIVLTAKDYQALVRNMKNQKNNGTILIKATPASAFTVVPPKDKPVLPKPEMKPPPAVVVVNQPPPEAQPIVIPPPPKLVSSGPSTVDDRALKRHQRMIKNRESAFLSRVRKKEYVTSLEQQIDSLQQENQYLKNENLQLLEKLKLRCSCGTTTIGTNTNFTKQITPNMRKNTAIVLAMLFMVSLNIGPLGNLLSTSNNDRSLMETSPEQLHHQRSLLWLDETANKFNVDGVPPTTNLTNTYYVPPSPVEDTFSVCPFYVNQTENIRLARELRRWIGENGYKNVTDRDGDDMSINSFSEMFALKDTIDSMYRQMKDISSQMETFKKRNKRAVASKKRIAAKKQRELELYQQQRNKKDADLAFYYAGFGKKYAKFFEEIGRRDDTFYLVSFSGEHLLLPALAHNKTNRPKMSLMLPAVMDNATHPSDKVTLMQIDCEVMNTSMIQIREKTIPGDLLRPAASPTKTSEQPVKRASTAEDFGERNVSRSERGGNDAGRKQLNRHPGVGASRPFFVQRMGEHLKDGLDLN